MSIARDRWEVHKRTHMYRMRLAAAFKGSCQHLTGKQLEVNLVRCKQCGRVISLWHDPRHHSKQC